MTTEDIWQYVISGHSKRWSGEKYLGAWMYSVYCRLSSKVVQLRYNKMFIMPREWDKEIPTGVEVMTSQNTRRALYPLSYGETRGQGQLLGFIIVLYHRTFYFGRKRWVQKRPNSGMGRVREAMHLPNTDGINNF